MTELVSVMKALQSNTSEDEVKRMMEELDTDLNGFINLKELCKSDLVFEINEREREEQRDISNFSVIDGCGV
ncbi:hypothetical protein ACSBR2_020561 [Camellia fascicularis]